MITVEVAIVKPATPSFALAPVRLDAITTDTADAFELAGPTDAEWDAMADESAASDRLDAGLLPW